MAEDLTVLLPDELMLEVLKYLSPPDRYRAGATCQRWYRLCADPAVWRRWHRRLQLPPMEERESRIECVSQTLWREQQATIRMHHLTNDCGIPGDGVLLAWSPERALVRMPSGGADVWSTEGRGKICSLRADDEEGSRAATVLSAHVFDDRAVTIDGHMGLRVWCLRTGRLLSALSGHGCPVIAMDLDEYLVTGGAEHRLGIWQAETSRCCGLLDHEPTTPVLVRCRGRRAITADWYGRAMLWDLVEPRCIRTLQTFKRGGDRLGCSLQVAISDAHVAVGARGGLVWLLSADTGDQIHEFCLQESNLFGVAIDSRVLVVSGVSGVASVFSVEPFRRLHFISVFAAGAYRTVLRHGLMFVQSDTLIQVFDVEKRRLLHTMPMPPLARRQLSVCRNKVLSVAHCDSRRDSLCFHIMQVKPPHW